MATPANVDPDELINAVAAAAHLGITPARVYLLSQEGKIGRKVAGYWVYTRPELDRWKAQRRNGRPRKSPQAAPVPARTEQADTP